MAQPQKTPSPPGEEMIDAKEGKQPAPKRGPPMAKKGGMGAVPPGKQSISEGLRAAMASAVKPPVKG